MRKQITEAMVAKLAPPQIGRLEIFDAIVPALTLRVTPNGRKTFVVRGRIKGQTAPIRYTIGDATLTKVADARRTASEVLRQMRQGVDPRPQQDDTPALTLDALITEWARLHLSQRRPRYREEATSALRRGLPNLLNKSAASVTRTDAVNALDRIVLAGHAVSARNVRAYASSCFGWAEARGKVESNPFARLPVATIKSERERVLSNEEVRAIWDGAGHLSYPFGPWYRLLMLTLQRREEVAGMRWTELDLDKAVWTLPGARMKNGQPHVVHLSQPACTILRSLPRLGDSDLVFTTGRRRTVGEGAAPVSGFSQAKRYLDAAIAEVAPDVAVAPWRPHDLRRTGVTWLAAAGFDSIVADKILAHQPTKLRGVAGVYQRHEFTRERATALDAWAAFVTGETVENVIELRRAAQ